MAYMDLDLFDRHSDEGVCPICKGNNFDKYTHSYPAGTPLYCKTCQGMPANCNGTVYVHSDNHETLLDCEICGEPNAEARTHAIFMRR